MRARGVLLIGLLALGGLAACGDDDDAAEDVSGTTTTATAPQETIPSSGAVDAMVAVSGHDVHVVCQGDGSPTVIIEMGLGQSVAAWNGTQAELAATHRTCAYERPGAGRSEPVDGPRTSQVIADELAELLDAAGIATPVVIVGHSIGGMHAEAFAQLHPDDVAGMVFVDPRTAEFEAGYRDLLTPEELETDTEQTEHDAASAPFGAEITASLESAEAIVDAGDLPDVPIIVLTAGVRPHTEADNDNDALWVGSQERLAEQSSNGRHSIVDGAEHEIWRSHSSVVVDAVLEVMSKIG